MYMIQYQLTLHNSQCKDSLIVGGSKAHEHEHQLK